jgi:HSP20 family protein
MKHQVTTQTAESPAIFKPLPEDGFFKIMADIRRLVARRAYELFTASGFTRGHDLDDWVQAESEIIESVPFEVSETQDAITAKAKLPGYSAKDIEIHVEPRRLFVSGRPQEKAVEEKVKTIHSEQDLNWLFCSLDLPAPIDPDKVSATLSNSELRIELPKCKTGAEISIAAKAAA